MKNVEKLAVTPPYSLPAEAPISVFVTHVEQSASNVVPLHQPAQRAPLPWRDNVVRFPTDVKALHQRRAQQLRARRLEVEDGR